MFVSLHIIYEKGHLNAFAQVNTIKHVKMFTVHSLLILWPEQRVVAKKLEKHIQM